MFEALFVGIYLLWLHVRRDQRILRGLGSRVDWWARRLVCMSNLSTCLIVEHILALSVRMESLRGWLLAIWRPLRHTLEMLRSKRQHTLCNLIELFCTLVIQTIHCLITFRGVKYISGLIICLLLHLNISHHHINPLSWFRALFLLDSQLLVAWTSWEPSFLT